MVLTNHIRYLLAACIAFMSSATHAGVMDFVSGIQKSVQETLSIGKIEPYIIPLEQGRLVEEKKFRQLDIGLSREQVKYLLGKPSSSPFNNDHWNYYYYNNSNSKEIKNLSVIFRNEKVFEIVVDQNTFKKFGQTENSQLELSDTSIIEIYENNDNTSREKVITVSLEDNDYLDEELGVCISNTFETFEDVKTLVISDESTLEIRADSQSQTGEEFLAEGNAEAERQSDLLKADKIKYFTNTKNVSASGNVGYFNAEISVYSESAEYQGMESDITFSKAKYYRSKNSGSGLSEKIIVKKNKDIHLEDASYTACNVDDPDWELTSTSTKLFDKDERGHSYNMLLKYKNIPIFYSPFISYPLTDKRQSGILTPSYGSSGDSGSALSVPYYFNLADNYDATIEVTSLSDRGVLFDNEFRYLGQDGNRSLINFAHLENDDEYGDDRYIYKINDDRILYDTLASNSNGLIGSIINSVLSYSRVSDREYFNDFGNSLSTVSQSSVKREIRLFGETYSDKNIYNYELSSVSYQPSTTGVAEQYETVPSFKFNYKNKNSSDFNYNVKASVDRFEHKDNSVVEGTRYLIYPSIEMPLLSDGWEVTPKFGVRYIDYSLDNNTTDPISKTTAIASLRGKLYFDKFVGDKLYTLEPEAYLLYIPVGNQDGNPLFDTGLKEFKYSLLSENKFYGEDRINDAKQISLALTHRVVDESSGDELFTGTIGQLIYFDDRDVHLTDGTKSHSDASNIIGLMTTRLSSNSSLSLGSVWNPHKGHGMRNNIRYRYNASSSSMNKLFNADYRYFRGSGEEIDLSGVYSFNTQFSIIGKYNYSFSNNRRDVEDLIDTMFGVEYDSCCYSFKIVARDYWTGIKKDNALFIEFLPKGLTTTNNKTSALLRKGIFGYEDRTVYE
jgi:LPS-assembly protein